MIKNYENSYKNKKLGMLITTKFSVGDTMWFMMANKAMSARVSGITITIGPGGQSILYTISISGERFNFDETTGFQSKEELLNSL